MANVPAPKGDPAAPLRALIFDSHVRPLCGRYRLFPRDGGHPHAPVENVRLMASGAEYEVLECGYLKPLGMETPNAS